MTPTWLQALMRPQFVLYLAMGVITALVDVGTMALLLSAGTEVQLATTSGFVVGLIVNYVLHSRVTFVARINWQTARRFWVIVLVNYGLTLLMVLAVQWLGQSALAGKLASLPVVAIHGFLLGKFWAFR